MHHTFYKTISYILFFGMFYSSVATSAPVFKVSKGKDIIYIGGTFHLLTEEDYPLQDAFETAYLKSDELYFETNIGVFNTPEFLKKSLAIMQYKDGQTLKTGLNQQTYARFVQYAKSRGLNPLQFDALNPTGVMLTITIMEYQARGFVAEGVDLYFYNRANTDNKKIAWFETPDEQLAIIDAFDNEDPNALINYTLDEIKDVDNVVNALHESWRDGDMKILSQIGLEGFDGYPDIYNALLADRNYKWMIDIEKMFTKPGTEFVLVGALHLPGKDGLLTQLVNKGYTVEKL